MKEKIAQILRIGILIGNQAGKKDDWWSGIGFGYKKKFQPDYHFILFHLYVFTIDILKLSNSKGFMDQKWEKKVLKEVLEKSVKNTEKALKEVQKEKVLKSTKKNI